jgi:hypothetical protein
MNERRRALGLQPKSVGFGKGAGGNPNTSRTIVPAPRIGKGSPNRSRQMTSRARSSFVIGGRISEGAPLSRASSRPDDRYVGISGTETGTTLDLVVTFGGELFETVDRHLVGRTARQPPGFGRHGCQAFDLFVVRHGG